MCIYIHIYICMYIYVSIYTYTYRKSYSSTSCYIWYQLSMYIHIRIYIYIYTYRKSYSSTSCYILYQLSVYIYIRIYMYIYIYIHTYIYIYLYIYICKHTYISTNNIYIYVYIYMFQAGETYLRFIRDMTHLIETWLVAYETTTGVSVLQCVVLCSSAFHTLAHTRTQMRHDSIHTNEALFKWDMTHVVYMRHDSLKVDMTPLVWDKCWCECVAVCCSALHTLWHTHTQMRYDSFRKREVLILYGRVQSSPPLFTGETYLWVREYMYEFVQHIQICILACIDFVV